MNLIVSHLVLVGLVFGEDFAVVVVLKRGTTQEKRRCISPLEQ